MGFRTIVVTERCKLDYKNNHMRKRCDDDQQLVFIDEVDTLIIESTAVTLTSYLLQELVKRKVKVIFCDTKHNPIAEVMPYAGAFDAARKIRQQISWSGDQAIKVWEQLIRTKILLQSRVLLEYGLQDEVDALKLILNEMSDQRFLVHESHAAKLYFSALFGAKFSRRNDGEIINSQLNYAYTIVLSALNRHISASGYLPLLGIFHRGPENNSNFGSDLIEPLRPIIDKWVIDQDLEDIGTDAKRSIVDILNRQVMIDDTKQYFSNAIEIYVRSVFRVLNDNEGEIKFCSLLF